MKFAEFIKTLSVFELAALSHELRKEGQDKRFLDEVLIEIGKRQVDMDADMRAPKRESK